MPRRGRTLRRPRSRFLPARSTAAADFSTRAGNIAIAARAGGRLSLILAGIRTRGGRRAWHATCPESGCAVKRGGPMPTIQRILVPTDFGATSAAALEYAMTLASELQAQLHVLHVVDDVEATLSELPGSFGVDEVQRELAAREPAGSEPETAALACRAVA